MMGAKINLQPHKKKEDLKYNFIWMKPFFRSMYNRRVERLLPVRKIRKISPLQRPERRFPVLACSLVGSSQRIVLLWDPFL